jgi:hypothetical protein
MDKSLFVLAGVILSIASVCIVIYLGFNYLLRKQKEEPIFVRKPRNAKKPNKFSGTKIPLPSDGFGYSTMMWLHINDIDYRRKKWKHIFNKGRPDALKPQPGMWLTPKDNTLLIRYTTLGAAGNYKITQNKMFSSITNDDLLNSSYIIKNNITLKELYKIADQNGNHGFAFASKRKPVNDGFMISRAMIKTRDIENDEIMDSTKYPLIPPGHKMYIAIMKKNATINPEFKNSIDNDNAMASYIKNIPLNRWFHVAIVVNAQSASVYIDGKLRSTTGLKDLIKQNAGDLYVTQRGGFGGMMTQLRYYGKPLEMSTVDWIYSLGPDPPMLPDLQGYIDMIKPPPMPKFKVNIKVDIDVGTGDEDEETKDNNEETKE